MKAHINNTEILKYQNSWECNARTNQDQANEMITLTNQSI